MPPTGDAKSRGFNGNLSTADNSMAYDRNGNLNKNLHKNVSTITYNHLNLPIVITFTSGNTIEFLYDAAGMKLRKTVKVGATVQYVQDYLPGGIEYRQNGTGVKRVESVFHAEGRYYNTNVDANNTISWRREYNIKDHLGNTRLVFTDRNANGVVDITGTASTSDVLQENHYYAFGLPFEGAWLQNDAAARDNKYQYNGKEFNDDFGLNWNDYGARWYDASVGRWGQIDPMAEKYSSWGTYSFCLNNPVLLMDPDGQEPIKPQAGTAGGFVNTINTTGTRLGLKKGSSAHDGLIALGKTEWTLDNPRPMPANTGRINTFRDKYIYTKKGGWIDMAHFMFYAGKAYLYKQQKKTAQGMIDDKSFIYMRNGQDLVIQQAAMDPVKVAVQDGYTQEASDVTTAKHSAYSYEDLPSDKFGAEFGANYFDPNSKLTFGEQLLNYLNSLGATSPENAPNYESLPNAEPNKKPSRTNKTTTPVYTEKNP